MSATQPSGCKTEFVTLGQAAIGCMGTVIAALIAGVFTFSTILVPRFFPTPGSASPGQPTTISSPAPDVAINFIADAVMAKQVDATTLQPSEITNTFPSDQKTFNLVVTFAGAPKDTAVKVVWLTASDTELAHYGVLVEGSDIRHFWYTPDAGHLEPGPYMVQVYVNNKLNRTLHFTVQSVDANTNKVFANWRVVLSDQFSSNVNGWNVRDRQPYADDYGTFEERITDGRLTVQIQASRSVAARYWPKESSLSDFYVSVQARRNSAPMSAPYGLAVRMNGHDNYYLFIIRDDGQFGIWVHQGTWTTLMDWTRSDAIRSTGNQLSILAQGSHFTFSINDQQVAQVDDNRLTGGTAGVVMELFNAGDAGTFEFSNFELRAP